MKTQQPPEAEDLRRLNLSNLFSLWESVGKANGALESHRGFKKIYHHGSSWPNRIWLTGEEDEECARAALENAARYLTRKDEPILLVLTEEQAAFSGDWLKKQGLSLLFSQTGMVLELERASDALRRGSTGDRDGEDSRRVFPLEPGGIRVLRLPRRPRASYATSSTCQRSRSTSDSSPKEWLERRFSAPITESLASTWPAPGQSTGERESPDG